MLMMSCVFSLWGCRIYKCNAYIYILLWKFYLTWIVSLKKEISVGLWRTSIRGCDAIVDAPARHGSNVEVRNVLGVCTRWAAFIERNEPPSLILWSWTQWAIPSAAILAVGGAWLGGGHLFLPHMLFFCSTNSVFIVCCLWDPNLVFQPFKNPCF